MTLTKKYGMNWQQIEQKYEWKRKEASRREHELFDVMNDASEQERLLLTYLYAYMPLHDLANYDGVFFLNHVRHALHIRQRLSWGMNIPDEIFMQFVLPYRINNENIDNSQQIISAELIPRVEQLSMYDAVLETNYWCHERATYTSTDIRTVSPLTIMRTALGRCGEQSTFTAAALRSIGIPARQCYTPRWSHCDSNHAWVEAWVDGQWHYLGACEPEPVLDKGWFRLPAKRAMLVHTRVFADYLGPEEVCSAHPWYTEINLLERYAAVHQVTIHIVDESGHPAEAEVQFQIYNAAEFYPIATLQTDEKGRVQLNTGYGDLLIHAHTADGKWGEAFLHTTEASELTLKLVYDTQKPSSVSNLQSNHPSIQWKVSPPAPVLDAGLQLDEKTRLHHEDRIQQGIHARTQYENSFMSVESITALAQAYQLSQEMLEPLLTTARGNALELIEFIKETDSHQRELALRLLQTLRPKDLQDTFRPSLHDHLNGAHVYDRDTDQHLFDQYILCPRIHFEMITPYRAYFASVWNDQQQQIYRSNPQLLAEEFQRSLSIRNEIDRYAGLASPVGAHQLGVTDALSRDILFVAAARSIGIPARLHPLQQQPQYFHADRWIDALFTKDNMSAPGKGIAEDAANDLYRALPESMPIAAEHKGKIAFLPPIGENNEEASYYQNMTLALWQDGVYRTLDLPYGEKELYNQTYEVVAGQYRLTTGTRLNDGSVIGLFRNYTILSGDTVQVAIEFRREAEQLPVLSEHLPESLHSLLFTNQQTVNQTAVIAWMEPEREPTKHLLREWKELKSAWDAHDESIHLLLSSEQEIELLLHAALPAHLSVHLDTNLDQLKQLRAAFKQVQGEQRPVVLVIDEAGRIRFCVQGYKPGTGSELLKVLEQLAE